MTAHESEVIAQERTEAALNPDRTHTPAADERDVDGDHLGPSCHAGLRVGRWHTSHPGEPCPDDPWWCSCGEPVPIDDPACTHGYFLCADHVDRCPECVAEKADARADFDYKYEKENGR